MPMIVLSYPAGAFATDKVEGLAAEMVSIFAENHVGLNLAERLSEATITKLVELPKGAMFMGKDASGKPCYHVEIVVPEGTMKAETKETMAVAMTRAILAAEGGQWTIPDAERVWCVFKVVPEGQWLVGGVAMTRKSILKRLLSGRVRNRETVSPAGCARTYHEVAAE